MEIHCGKTNLEDTLAFLKNQGYEELQSEARDPSLEDARYVSLYIPSMLNDQNVSTYKDCGYFISSHDDLSDMNDYLNRVYCDNMYVFMTSFIDGIVEDCAGEGYTIPKGDEVPWWKHR